MENVLLTLYGEAVTEESLAKFREELGKKFVPKSDFNQRGDELKMLREKLGELEAAATSLETLEKEKQALSEELSLVKSQFEKEMAAAKEKEKEMALSQAIDGALAEAKAKSLPAARALLNFEEISFEDGVVTGAKEQVEALKQTHGYLFEADEMNLQFVRPSMGNTAFSSEEFQKLGYMERLKLKKEQPELYQTLTQNIGGKHLWQRI